MEGSTHRIIAPIFTLGTSVAYMSSNANNLPLGIYGTAFLASAVSVVSANWADADLHAMHKPLPVIWAGFNPMLDGFLATTGLRRVKRKDEYGRVNKVTYVYMRKQYSQVRKFDQRVFATLFRITGLRKHRGWQSHSPIVWIPLWVFLYNMSNKISDPMYIIPTVVLGLALGYISHLVGDVMTKSGLPILPELKIFYKVPVIGKHVKKFSNAVDDVKIFRGKFFTAGNKTWNFIVIILLLELSGYLAFPEIISGVNKTIFSLLQIIFQFIMGMFNS